MSGQKEQSRFIYVEPDEQQRETMGIVLVRRVKEAQGATVDAVATLEEADILLQQPNISETRNVLLVTIGADHEKSIQWIKNVNRDGLADTSIIAISDESDYALRQQIQEAGAMTFLVRPFSVEKLQEAVSEALGD